MIFRRDDTCSPIHDETLLARLCITCGPGQRTRLEDTLRQAHFAEIRFDLLEDCPTSDDVRKLVNLPRVALATCRAGRWTDEIRARLLSQAVRFGATFVDVEDDAAAVVFETVTQATRAFGAKLILSRHDFSGVPPLQMMTNACRNAFERGADLFKLACVVADEASLERLLAVAESAEFSGKVVCVGMGEHWALHARAKAVLRGTPWTYVAPDEGDLIIPGQPRLNELLSALAYPMVFPKEEL